MIIQIAECVIKFKLNHHQKINFYHRFRSFFEPFVTNKKKAHYNIIFSEGLKKIKLEKNNFFIPQNINLSGLILLIRSILRVFLQKKGFFFHCSANAINKKEAVLFIGPSRAGKTTISKLIDKKYPKLIDDVGIILRIKNDYYIYQTIFPEKDKIIKSKKGYKIKSIYILKKSKINKVFLVNNDILKLKKIFYQCWIDKKLIKDQFHILKKFILSKPIFILFFNKDKEKLVKFFDNQTHL